MERTVQGVRVEVSTGDIADQPDMDAVVNAANAQMRMGGGVAGAIHRAGGPGLTEETRDLAPIEPGQAVISGAHDLPNRHVIHCLGPVYGRDEPADELLGRCFEAALHLADGHGVKSVAFPAISTGAFGYPTREAAEVAVAAVVGSCGDLGTVEHVRFVLFTEDDARVFREALEARLP